MGRETPKLLVDLQHQSTFSDHWLSVTPEDTLIKSDSEEASLSRKSELLASLLLLPELLVLLLTTEDTDPTSWKRETSKDSKNSNLTLLSSQELPVNQRRVLSTIPPPVLKTQSKTLRSMSIVSHLSPKELEPPSSPRR